MQTFPTPLRLRKINLAPQLTVISLSVQSRAAGIHEVRLNTSCMYYLLRSAALWFSLRFFQRVPDCQPLFRGNFVFIKSSICLGHYLPSDHCVVIEHRAEEKQGMQKNLIRVLFLSESEESTSTNLIRKNE